MQAERTLEIRPFTIEIAQDVLDDLRDRLARTRFANDLPGVGWDYGTPTSYLQELVAYWRETFDWRVWEAKLNSWPQFTTEIDGENLHFLHVRSPHEDATPLVLLHGWPGSILEFQHMIEPLTVPEAHGGNADDAFHLVIPSLPGFGFSGPTQSTGWEASRMARAIAELMRRLGYDRYGAQGGDFGQFVAVALGQVDTGHVMGVHVNAASFGFIPMGEPDEEEIASLSEVERERIARRHAYQSDGNAYFQIQATRPQTIAAGLSDSPVGQLAWIVEKFREWTHGDDESGDIPIPRDIILADVMLYWLTNTSASSARLYYESMHVGAWNPPSDVPVGVAVFAEDIAIRRYGEQFNNIVHWSDFDRGGHFAALEVPDLLIQDVRAFFRALRLNTVPGD